MNKFAPRQRLIWLLQGSLTFAFVHAAGTLFAAEKNRAPVDNSRDLAIVERALAGAQPGQKSIAFGDVGLAAWQLRTIRDRLLAEQSGDRSGIQANTDTPLGTAYKWPGGILPYRFDPTEVGNGTITAAKMQQFRDSVAEWAAFANVQFNEFTGGTPANFITVQETPASAKAATRLPLEWRVANNFCNSRRTPGIAARFATKPVTRSVFFTSSSAMIATPM